MRFVTLLAVLGCCGAAAPASAQATSAQATFGQVRAKGTPTVYVTDRAGQDTQGQLITFSESEITIKTGALTKTFTADQVSLIERKGDSRKNGAIIGAVIGIAVSVIGSAEMCSEDHFNGRSCAGSAATLTLINTAFFAGVGAGIDALIPGRTRIWPGKSGKAGGIAFAFSPRDHRAFIGWRVRVR
jgi:hypothetical protein